MVPESEVLLRTIRAESNYVFARAYESDPPMIVHEDGTELHTHPTGVPMKILTEGYSGDFQSYVSETFHQYPGSVYRATVTGHICEQSAAARLSKIELVSEKSLLLGSADTSTVAPLQRGLRSINVDPESGGTSRVTTEDEETVVANVQYIPISEQDFANVVAGKSDFFDRKFDTEVDGTAVEYVLCINMRETDYTALVLTPYHDFARSVWDKYIEDSTNPNLFQYKGEQQYDNFELQSNGVMTLTENPPVKGETFTPYEWVPFDGSESKTKAAEDTAGGSDGIGSVPPSADEPEEVIASVADDLEYMWQADSDVKLSDYGGRPSLCETLQSDVVVPFRDQPEKAAAFDIPIPSLLLHGPPGTGKTYMAEALAGELGYPYVALSGGDVLSQWINASAGQIKTLFEEAEFMASNCGGAMIFIDEIDSVLNNRQSGNQHREDQKAVNEFLAHIDQPGEDNILFVGATNVFDEIDPAAVSRFDRTLHVGLPDKETRKEIFAVQLRDRPIALSETHFEKLAAGTEGHTARDIKKMVTDASRYAAFKSDKDKITFEHCRRAVIQFDQS